MFDNFVGYFAIGSLTTRAIILIRLPGGVLSSLLVDDEAFWTWRIKFDLHIVDLERFAQVECQIHRVGILDALEHCLRLPPGDVALAVVVVEVLGRVALLVVVAHLAPRMIPVPKVHVAEFAQFALAAVTRVVAVLQAAL